MQPFLEQALPGAAWLRSWRIKAGIRCWLTAKPFPGIRCAVSFCRRKREIRCMRSDWSNRLPSFVQLLLSGPGFLFMKGTSWSSRCLATHGD
ncbi:hypothetical protein D3C80_1968140 [compost metagenome]